MEATAVRSEKRIMTGNVEREIEEWLSSGTGRRRKVIFAALPDSLRDFLILRPPDMRIRCQNFAIWNQPLNPEGIQLLYFPSEFPKLIIKTYKTLNIVDKQVAVPLLDRLKSTQLFNVCADGKGLMPG